MVSSRGFRNARGSILIMTLWIVTLLSLMAFGLVTTVRMGLRQEQWSRLDFEGRELLASLGGLCLSRLRADTETEFDSYKELWGHPFRADGASVLSGFEGIDPVSADFELSIIAADESGKVNVNFASEELLIEILREAGANADVRNLAAAIIDWRDPDSVGPAEADFYAGLDPSYQPANEDLVRIEELLFVHGVQPLLFFGEDANHNGQLDQEEDDGDIFLPPDNADGKLQLGLIDLLTVHGDGEINVNCASEPVLQASFRTVLETQRAERLATILLDRRRGPDEVDGTDDDHPFESYADFQTFLEENLEEYEIARLETGEVEFGVSSSGVRFHLTVNLPDRHATMMADVLVTRETDEVEVLEWHES